MKCCRCNSEVVPGASQCPMHMVRSRILAWIQQRPSCKPHFPSGGQRGRSGSDPAAKLAQKLLRQLELQQGKCAISGKPIILGVNASIDHIRPISQRPDLAFELSNLRWVDIKENQKATRGKPKKAGVKDEEKLLNALVAVKHKACSWTIDNQQLSEVWEEIQNLISCYEAKLNCKDIATPQVELF